MNKPPAFQFYANDWLSSTTIALMSAEEERGYLRLLLHCWNSGDCSLPDDDKVLARLSLISEGWLKGSSKVVRDCFVLHPEKPGYLTNKKLYCVWKDTLNWREKCAEGGRKSAKVRKQRGSQKGLKKKRRVVGRVLEVNGQVNGNPSPSPSPSCSCTNVQEHFDQKYSDGFLIFWKVYPRKVGKQAAWKEWQQAIKRTSVETIQEAVVVFAGSPWGKSEYCWHPRTWLSQGHWDDDRTEWERSGSADPSADGSDKRHTEAMDEFLQEDGS